MEEREIRIEQRRRLYQLLVVQKYPEKVDELIRQIQAEMDAEDIAYVEKQLKQMIEEQE